MQRRDTRRLGAGHVQRSGTVVVERGGQRARLGPRCLVCSNHGRIQAFAPNRPAFEHATQSREVVGAQDSFCLRGAEQQHVLHRLALWRTLEQFPIQHRRVRRIDDHELGHALWMPRSKSPRAQATPVVSNDVATSSCVHFDELAKVFGQAFDVVLINASRLVGQVVAAQIQGHRLTGLAELAQLGNPGSRELGEPMDEEQGPADTARQVVQTNPVDLGELRFDQAGSPQALCSRSMSERVPRRMPDCRFPACQQR